MKIKFNIQETIQREYELDELDSEKVRRRAKEIENMDFGFLEGFYIECAVQELLREDKIVANLIHRETDQDITSAWVEEDS